MAQDRMPVSPSENSPPSKIVHQFFWLKNNKNVEHWSAIVQSRYSIWIKEVGTRTSCLGPFLCWLLLLLMSVGGFLRKDTINTSLLPKECTHDIPFVAIVVMGHGRAEKKHLWKEDMMMMYMGNVPQFLSQFLSPRVAEATGRQNQQCTCVVTSRACPSLNLHLPNFTHSS
jgi:hypothetical protein